MSHGTLVMLAAFLLAVVASAAEAECVTKTYDASLGTFPDAQGFTLYDDGGSPPYTLADGALHQGPTIWEENQEWLSDNLVFDFTDGVFSMEANLEVISSSYSSIHRRAGFVLVARDTLNRRFRVDIASDRVVVTTDNAGEPDELMFNTIDGFPHHYRLVVDGMVGRLYIDHQSEPSLSIPVGPTGMSGPANTADFGDGTVHGNSETFLTRFSYTVDADDCAIPTVSEWGLIVLTLLLLTAGTVVIGRGRPAAA